MRNTTPAAVDDARMVSQVEYPTVNPGEAVSIWFVVQNSGTSTWRGGGGDGYQYRGFDRWAGQSWNICCNLGPSQQDTFRVNFNAPQQPGSHRNGMRLSHNSRDFGPYFYVDVTVRNSGQPDVPGEYRPPMRGRLQNTGPSPGKGAHTGRDEFAIDLVSDNTAVYPVAGGKVIYAWHNCQTTTTTCYGNTVIIDHRDGFYSVYAHLAYDGLTPSDTEVDSNKQIGVMGETGCPRCGAHRHFAMRQLQAGLRWDQVLWHDRKVNVWDIIPGLPPSPSALESTAADAQQIASAPSQPCGFKLGFKMLRDQIPDIVGTCLVDEHHNPSNGDGLQETSGPAGQGGLLVWRKSDNWTAYTDGYRTWINGPRGLQARLNTERFAWEG